MSAATGSERRVMLCSGHMIDAPERASPRFPPDREHAVRDAMVRVLDGWRAGPHDIGICGGARGADILFAEAMLGRGSPVRLLIALPEDEFIKRSVALPGSDWERRYRALRERCETHFQHREWSDRYPELDVFSRNNLWCIETAASLAPASEIYAVLVWDGKTEGDGPGGTADFSARIEKHGGHVAIIDPQRV